MLYFGNSAFRRLRYTIVYHGIQYLRCCVSGRAWRLQGVFRCQGGCQLAYYLPCLVLCGIGEDVPIPFSHNPLIIDEAQTPLSHLDAFRVDMPGRGVDGGDLRVVVNFSTHVFSERATFGRRRDLQDHGGTWRTFCPKRYEVSKVLPSVVKDAVAIDHTVSISHDFNKSANLILIEPYAGESWAVFFCFDYLFPGVVLSVLSAYPKTGNIQGHEKRNKISYFARKALFTKAKVP